MVQQFEDVLYLIMYHYISKLCHAQILICQQSNIYFLCLFRWENQTTLKIPSLQTEALANLWNPTSMIGSPCLSLLVSFILLSLYFRPFRLPKPNPQPLCPFLLPEENLAETKNCPQCSHSQGNTTEVSACTSTLLFFSLYIK